ncbi:hypothetical protein T265_03333 [Opisthorchis viverrini]|uniref:Uncharacterized protein n=1 Tax=Opisthorchis viverrini TaxID=6198 RepID=A0A074ZWD4_OPIVI|nr:hypothetical protein T265_03333 [Opisthorchis viverrini]KER30177.1 hypothetical protein T265_03333 [Opisthorchis viverrini]
MMDRKTRLPVDVTLDMSTPNGLQEHNYSGAAHHANGLLCVSQWECNVGSRCTFFILGAHVQLRPSPLSVIIYTRPSSATRFSGRDI